MGVIVAGMVCAGCQNGVTTPYTPKPEDLIGIWKHDSGTDGLATFFTDRARFDTQYVEILDAQKARIYAKSYYGIIAEFAVTYALMDDMLMVTSDIDAFDPIVITYSMSSIDSLSTDFRASPSSFSRVDAVPADARDLPLYVAKNPSPFTAIPSPVSGLAVNQGYLWFRDNNIDSMEPLHAIDPNSGVVANFDLMLPYDYPQTAQGDDRWFNCCELGILERRDPNYVLVDSIDLNLAYGKNTDIESAAFDASTQYLWVSGLTHPPMANAREELIAIDRDGTNVVVKTFEFQVMDGLEVHGASLWGLVRVPGVLVKIDPDTGLPLFSYLIPDAGGQFAWTDLAFVGNKLYLVGHDITHDRGVYMQVSFFSPVNTNPGGMIGIGG